MVTFLWLGLAIVAEVSATTSLKLSEGFSRPLPTVIVVVGYVIAFFAMSRVLRAGLGIGATYAIWSAIGVAGVAIIGWLALGEQMNITMAAGLALVIGGVVLLEVGQGLGRT